MAHPFLGVNIDHIATVRNVRAVSYPDPAQAAFIAEQAGADAITVHLREDRRHISERDVRLLRQTLQTRMNLEMAPTEEMLSLAQEVKPHACCLVPERRQEITTERGLEVVGQFSAIKRAVDRLSAAGIQVSLFIDPEQCQVDAAVAAGAAAIEIHTGAYAEATRLAERSAALQTITAVAKYAARCQLQVNAGHGLNYHNVQPIAALPWIQELNIGHAIIARALMQGLAPAVAQMKQLLLTARA